MYNLNSTQVSQSTSKLSFIVFCEKITPSAKFKKWTKSNWKRSSGSKETLWWNAWKCHFGLRGGRVSVFPLLFYRHGVMRLELASIFVSRYTAHTYRIGIATFYKRLTIFVGCSSHMDHHEANRKWIKFHSQSFRGAPRFKTKQWWSSFSTLLI